MTAQEIINKIKALGEVEELENGDLVISGKPSDDLTDLLFDLEHETVEYKLMLGWEDKEGEAYFKKS